MPDHTQFDLNWMEAVQCHLDRIADAIEKQGKALTRIADSLEKIEVNNRGK